MLTIDSRPPNNSVFGRRHAKNTSLARSTSCTKSEGAGIVESDFVPKKTRALAQGKINTTVHGDGLVIAGRPFHFIPGHRISEI